MTGQEHHHHTDAHTGLDGIATAVILVASALLIVGVVMLGSTSADLEKSIFDFASWRAPMVRQALFAAVGVCVMLVGARVGPGFLRWRTCSILQPSVFLLFFAVALLVLVWAPGLGHESHGRNRWIDLGFISFQPSEIAKFALVAFLASFLTRERESTASHRPDLTIPMIGVGIVCALVGAEDFGTAFLLAMVGGLVIVVRGCPLSTILSWSIPVTAAFSYLLFSQSYRVERLMSFRNIWDDRFGAGFHPIQSLGAIASGRWTGRGLGAGLAKYGYLPEHQTDFIFAIICEETGAFGGACVILLYAALVSLGILTVRRAVGGDGGFARLFAFGIIAVVAAQAVMNIAVVTVIAPTKGIGLPLISSGGSGVLCFCAAIGLLAGVRRTVATDTQTTAPSLDVRFAGSLSQGAS